jgi:hypothetical protein
MEAITITVLTGFIITLFVIYGAFSWGFVAYKVYYWFIPLIIPTYPEFTYIQFVALMPIIGIFKSHSNTSFKDEITDKNKTAINSFLAPWFTLLAGWILHQFI